MEKIIDRFTPSDIERFWAKVAIADKDSCWEWQAGKDKDGYGRFKIGSRVTAKQLLAHRVASSLAAGAATEDPPVVRHTCDNPACCNPAHLQGGTHAENMRDMVTRGRSARSFGHAKLDWEVIDAIRASSLTGAEWSRRLGTSKGNISDIRNGKTWKESQRDVALLPLCKAA
jgi:hypothetical protein